MGLKRNFVRCPIRHWTLKDGVVVPMKEPATVILINILFINANAGQWAGI